MAGDLLGADGVIALVQKATGSNGEQPKRTGREEAARLAQDLEAFKVIRSKLAPEEAVDRWMKLHERFVNLPPDAFKPQQMNYSRRSPTDLTLRSLVSAIPSPPAWESLKSRILAQKATNGGVQDTVLKALVYYLTQDTENLRKTIDQLKANETLKGNNASGYLFRDLRVEGQYLKGRLANDNIVETFDSYLQTLKSERPEGRVSIQAPDLVKLAGQKRAEELILKALAVPGLSLSVPSGGVTLELAKQLTLANATALTDPQWELVTGFDDIELFEAMAKRFPEKSKREQTPTDLFQAAEQYNGLSGNNDERRGKARVIYLLGLIARDRVKDATAQALLVDTEQFQDREFEKQWHSFDKMRYAAGLNRFCKALLSDRPELPLWKQCGVIAPGPDGAAELIASVETAAQRTDVGVETKLGIRERQVELLLALDRVDDALDLLRKLVKVDAARESSQVQRGAGLIKLRLAARLCTLGRLLDRPGLVRESQEAFLATLGHEGMSIGLSEIALVNVKGSNSPVGEMVESYLDRNDFSGAEKVVLTAMRAVLKAPELAELPAGRDLAFSSGLLSGYLSRLAEIYDKAGRHEDVLALLDKAPWWGATDLIDLADSNDELPVLTAKALHATGRDVMAVEILKSHLLGKPGDDAAYATLTEILSLSLIPWLDTLQARDRFEERPLIWKGRLLLGAGKLDEAEATIRQALKIDPTDGEQEPGDRGRAYVVLADILKAKGKKEDAAFFDRVVSAVHIAETGDKLNNAGLTRKSLAKYEEASRSFVDAYCVQWRMAERLSAMGDMESARKHYEIAFERMPEQFGQVASFCFGCEGVFTHQQSVSVAEKVLTGLVTSNPRKPQVRYLMGKLRESQGRRAEAYQHFRMAADLDPHYLDALKAAYELRKDVFLDQVEADKLALRVVDLDPLNRHDHLAIGEITDVRGLWKVYEEKGRDSLMIPKSLYPLAASKQGLEALLKKFGASAELLDQKSAVYQEQRMIPEPGDAVVKNVFINKLLQVTGQGGVFMY